MTANTTRVLSPEEITARQLADAPFLRLPERSTLFAEREMRLRQLANGHAMRDFLLFMADLAHEQQALLSASATVPVPDASALARAGAAGVPPLDATAWPRDAAWRDGLRRLVQGLQPRAPAGPLADTLARLATAPDDWLEVQADRLLQGVMLGLDLAAAPLLAAALQAHWSHLVLEVQRLYGALRESPFGRIDDRSVCPCCGSRPTASITRAVGEVQGQRYLACSLCSVQWHRVRVQCARCASDRVHFQSLLAQDEADDSPSGVRRGALQAECCDDCGHYLKIMHSEIDPFVEPAADDLASLTLDLLVADTGQQRHGVNLMLLFGDPDDPGAETATDPGGG